MRTIDLIKPAERIDWRNERDRIDLASVVTGLLGPAQGRRGEKGRKLWWCCPLHQDANPSFSLEPGSAWWRCFGCGESGDAASLLMKVEGLSFPEAVARLVGEVAPSVRPRQAPAPRIAPPPVPSGLPADEALTLVLESEDRLWSPAGKETLEYLTCGRGLDLGTIRSARLGWTPAVGVPTKFGKLYSAQGITIPWFDGPRLALVKIRQPCGCRPKYVEAFRDLPTLYPGPEVIGPGRPLVIVEGEFDALMLGQELAEMASVVTLGGASNRPSLDLMGVMLAASPWFAATDADAAGEKAAALWPARTRRARPPAHFKDWCEAKEGGVDLRRWWTDRLAGDEQPSLFGWAELQSQRWGPDLSDPEPGIMIDRPDTERRRLALESIGPEPSDAREDA